MRVAYVTADFGVPPLGTKGASVHVRRLVAALADEGHEVLLVTPDAGAGAGEALRAELIEQPFDEAGRTVHEAIRREPIARGNRLSKDLRNLLYAAWLPTLVGDRVARFEPDFVYERYSLFGTPGLTLARRLGVPLLLEVNAPLVEEQRDQRGLSLPVTATDIQGLVFRGADHVFVVSDWLEDYARRHGAPEDRISVLPNAADPDLFSPRPAAPRRRQLGWDDRFVAGFVGSMKSWHGLSSVLDAFERLGALRRRCRLLLVGDGPEREPLQRRIESSGLADQVHLTGAVPYPEVPEWIAAMDVTLAPYDASADGYFSPVKIFEYMAMARPVIAADTGPTRTVIDDGRTGWLYEPGDAAGLAARLEWVARHPDRATAAGEAARRVVLDRHTWRHNARTVAQIAELIIRARGGRTGSARAASRST